MLATAALPGPVAGTSRYACQLPGWRAHRLVLS